MRSTNNSGDNDDDEQQQQQRLAKSELVGVRAGGQVTHQAATQSVPYTTGGIIIL